LFAAWIHLGSVPAIWQTRYGQLLIIKLTILSVVAVTGAYNWLRVKPTLGHVEGGVRIRRSATVEVVIGVLVLLVTAILVATPTAMDMQM
jgi:putative copper export protein